MTRSTHSPVARRSLWTSIFAVILSLALLGSYGFSSIPGPAKALAASPHVKMGGTVVIDNVSGSLWTCGFNPYSSSGSGLSAGIFYEPLIYINGLTSAVRPWLATGYGWSHGNRWLTFTIRSGVRWSDGKPFTPADVVFTFRLMKRFSGLDLQAVWTVLSAVFQRGNQVVFTFKQPAVPFFYYIADQNYMLPQHIWSHIGNPVNYLDKHPVGTGPFLLKSCSPQNVTYVRNPHYWQAPKPYVSTVQYPAFLDNQPGNRYLAEGKANWGGQYIPNIGVYYISRDPAHRHYWYPPSADIGLYINQTVYPLTIPAVRQALSYAIDRGRVSRIGVYGYLPPANQTGVVLPTQKIWYNAGLANRYNYHYDPAKAIALLQTAGFKKGSDGIFRKGGKKLSLSILNTGAFTDWVAEVSIIQQNLKQVGIELKPENLEGNTHTAREQSGNFQLDYGGPAGGPSPYYWFRALLHSANTAAIGQTATSNFERYRNPAVDRLLNQFAVTTNVRVQRALINEVEGYMLRDVPFIPVLEGVHWYQYDTTQLTGWPTKSNPYASPAPYDLPDWEVTLLNLHLK